MIRSKPKMLAVLLALLLVFSSNPVPVLAAEVQSYQNPSLEETARKLEIIARSKNIPSAILKVIAFVESGWRQFDKNGNVVTNNAGPRPSLGIMQVTSYKASDTELVKKLKYDIDFNIAYGADILNAKWDVVPIIGDGDRNKLENWYFALWAYNSWGTVNNPNNATARGRVAYQEAIIRRAATEYIEGLVTPVQITPLSPELIPLGTVPKKSQTWVTPEPYTLGDLKVGLGDNVNRGSGQEPHPLGTVSRIAGQTRIDTVNQIAIDGWPSGTETVIITRSDDFPDALAGVPLAQKYNAPILITNPNELETSVIQTLNTLKPLRVIILGGESAISTSVENKLREVLYWSGDIQRIAGQNRYETAALIAQDFPKEASVALATGADFPDALSLAAAAASRGIPLLLTSPHELPEATRRLLQELLPRKIYVAGGEKVVSNQILANAAREVGVPLENVVRFAGANRYETSVKVAENFYPAATELYLATGRDFADPLAAAALAAKSKACLLLVSRQGFAVNSSAERYIKQQQPSTNVKVIGGEGIIPEEVITTVKYLLKQM